jgi:hypothetical protein
MVETVKQTIIEPKLENKFYEEFNKYTTLLRSKLQLLSQLSVILTKLQRDFNTANEEYKAAANAINTIEELLMNVEGYSKEEFSRLVLELSKECQTQG